MDPGYRVERRVHGQVLVLLMRPPPLRLSLSGAGFLGSYHLGVGRALQRRLEQPAAEVAGASAGAIVGAVLLSETPLEAARASLKALVAHTLASPLGVLTPGFSLVDAVRGELSARLPSDAHRLASGRLHVALTSLRPGELGRIHYKSVYGSRDELIDAVSASSDIPGFTSQLRAPSDRSGGPSAGGPERRQTVWQRLTGKSDVDGGLFDIFPDPWRGQLPATTFVSPFAGVGFAIAPRRGVSGGCSLRLAVGFRAASPLLMLLLRNLSTSLSGDSAGASRLESATITSFSA